MTKAEPDDNFRLLFSRAKKFMEQAYSPYSRVKVGAAALMSDGRVYAGCNVENVSYGATICAERVAITRAASEGAGKIKAILVVTNQKQIWPPCGMCRQVIAEFAQKSTLVYCTDLKKNFIKKKFSDLFPGSFGPEFLLK
jgi:cytidine deaminase